MVPSMMYFFIMQLRFSIRLNQLQFYLQIILCPGLYAKGYKQLRAFIFIIHTMKILIFLLILLALTSSFVLFKNNSTPPTKLNDSIINVFLIPHSHDDVGWLKTPDDYYYGGEQQTHYGNVHSTIDSVVTELLFNADFKFSIVEIAYLDMWWRGANQTMKDLMTDHIKKGRIEFLNGGWCMSDEATVYYEDAIDQTTLGMRWIKEKFGSIPKVAWQLDPFGHQASFSTLGHQFGFNSIFFARVHYQDKNARELAKAMEMVWKPPQVSGNEDSLLAHINFYMYNPPAGFCYDQVCMDEPIKSDPTLQGYNIVTKSQAFADYFKNMSKSYRSSNLFHTLGSDFQWSNARLWTMNIGKLISYINNHSQLGVKIKYATPSEYIDAIYKDNITYPTKKDDFFPYADYTDAYWSGYFTSRVSIKGLVRDGGRWLQSVRTHLALLKMSNASSYLNSNLNESEQAITMVQKAMGVLQHHDAVTGTQKQKVANSYVRTFSKAKYALTSFFDNIIKQQTFNIIGEMPQQIYQTHWNSTANQWAISKSLKQNKIVLLNLYNPGASDTYPIRVKVNPQNLTILGTDNNQIAGQIICGNPKDSQDCQLFFNLKINETSWSYVKLRTSSSSGNVPIIPPKDLTILSPSKQIKLSSTASVKIHRSEEKFELTLPSGLHTFSLAYNYYESFQDSGQKSGAYIFRPSAATKNSPRKYSSLKNLSYFEGEHMVVISMLEQKTYTKLYFSKTSGYLQKFGVQIQTFVDSINVADKQGKQVVLDISTNVMNNKTFYTDSNGLEQQKRILNTMQTWNITVHQPVAGNYYPLNSHIKINDSKQTVSVLVDRARGASVLKDGVFQLMLHRRMLMDDGRGVGEALNQTQANGQGLVQKVRNYLLFGNNNRYLQKVLDQPIILTWSNSISQNFNKYQPKGAALSVPKQVKLWLRYMPDDSYLLRVQYIDYSSSSSSNIDVSNQWNITELSLGANQLLSEMKKNDYKWRSSDSTSSESLWNSIESQDLLLKGGSITLKALEIRTFSLKKN